MGHRFGIENFFNIFLCPCNKVFAVVRISECKVAVGSMPRSHHVPLSREKKNKNEEIISFLLCSYRRDSPFPLESSPPCKSTISPAANRLFLGLSSFHITGNLHFLRVFFFFPSFFFAPPRHPPGGWYGALLRPAQTWCNKASQGREFSIERVATCVWRVVIIGDSLPPPLPLHYTSCPTSAFHPRSPLDSAQEDLPMLMNGFALV